MLQLHEIERAKTLVSQDGQTLADIARSLGVSRSTVRRILHGTY